MKRLIGKDCFGNKYYQDSSGKRFVEYDGFPEPTKIDKAWHPWLHHYGDQPSVDAKSTPKISPSQLNLTGTKLAYHPNKGKKLNEKKRTYEPWRPC